MLEAFTGALEATDLAQYLRRGRWSYALVNAGHITGLALLFGAIAALDLRMLGLGRQIAIRPLSALLVPVAGTGLALAATTGFLLFMVGAADYIAEPVFLLKLGLVFLAVLNALLLRAAPAWRDADLGEKAPARLRWAAGLSLALWLGVIVCGRLLGFL